MSTITLFHGTTAASAGGIQKEGFVPDKKYNWDVPSKEGFVYLSTAYAPFYASIAGQACKRATYKLALIKVEVDTDNCFPEDDFIMQALGKKTFTQDDLTEIELEAYEKYWDLSLKRLGNVAVYPEDAHIVGVRFFGGKDLIYRCDPVIGPMNYLVMGNYYKRFTKWLYDGNDVLDFERI